VKVKIPMKGIFIIGKEKLLVFLGICKSTVQERIIRSSLLKMGVANTMILKKTSSIILLDDEM
jgi:hypothetical protein